MQEENEYRREINEICETGCHTLHIEQHLLADLQFSNLPRRRLSMKSEMEKVMVYK